MHGNEMVGILLDGNPGLDRDMIPIITNYIKTAARRMSKAGQPVTQRALADELGISRNRAARTVKALGITHIMDGAKGA